MIESTFGAKLLAWLVGLVPAILGSAISLTMPSEEPKPSGWRDYARMGVTFGSGVILAQIAGSFILEHWPAITAASATFFIIKFAIGLFGMRAATTFYVQIPEVWSMLRDKFGDLLTVWKSPK